jgi:hypothetical protein
MVEPFSLKELKNFFFEIYEIIKKANKELIEIWIELSEMKFISQFTQSEIRDFFSYFEFIAIKKGNYTYYAVINKIKFITECFKYLAYDIKDLAEFLDFGGFEALIQEILIQNNYKAIKNFRFSDKSNYKFETSQKRYEIDIIALSQNYMLIIDAKQWRRKDSYSAMNKAANLQFQRALALKKNPEIFSNLTQNLINIKTNVKKRLPIILIPVMVTLELNWIKINENSVPLVCVQNFNSFLQELGINLEYFRTIKVAHIQKQLF